MNARKMILPALALGAAHLGAAQPTSAQTRLTGLPKERPVAPQRLEQVFAFRKQMPVGVAISSRGRKFISYPRWEDPVSFTLAELKNGVEVPYPSGGAIQKGNLAGAATNMVSLQGLIIDARDRLWVLDTGTVNMKPVAPFTPKLICINTNTDRIERTYTFPREIALPTTYLNDLRIDLGKGSAGFAYITDSGGNGPCGIIVVDLANGRAVRRLGNHPSVKPQKGFVGFVEGRAFYKRPSPGVALPTGFGSDGIAISPDGGTLLYAPTTGRRLYAVPTDVLRDKNAGDTEIIARVKDLGENGVSDGLGEDVLNRVYTTNYEQNAVMRRYSNGRRETVVADPRLLWPDTIAIGRDGYLYVIADQLHRQPSYNEGRDIRQKPYSLFRVKVGTQPVLLK